MLTRTVDSPQKRMENNLESIKRIVNCALWATAALLLMDVAIVIIAIVHFKHNPQLLP